MEPTVQTSVMSQSYTQTATVAHALPLLNRILDEKSIVRCAFEHLDGLLLAGCEADVSPEKHGEACHPVCGPADASRARVELTLAR